MTPKIRTDSTEPPIVDVLIEHLPWTEVENYVRVSQRFLLVTVPDTGERRGVCWTGTRIVTTEDLGQDEEEALRVFRNFLRQPKQDDAPERPGEGDQL